jgi:hypothetical protein
MAAIKRSRLRLSWGCPKEHRCLSNRNGVLLRESLGGNHHLTLSETLSEHEHTFLN